MWKFLKALFEKKDRTEAAYQGGRDMVDRMLAAAHDPKGYAHILRERASGGFNTKPEHYAFDRGVNTRLTELGYD